MNFHKPANAMLDADKQRKIFCVYTFNKNMWSSRPTLVFQGRSWGCEPRQLLTVTKAKRTVETLPVSKALPNSPPHLGLKYILVQSPVSSGAKVRDIISERKCTVSQNIKKKKFLDSQRFQTRRDLSKHLVPASSLYIPFTNVIFGSPKQ